VTGRGLKDPKRTLMAAVERPCLSIQTTLTELIMPGPNNPKLGTTGERRPKRVVEAEPIVKGRWHYAHVRLVPELMTEGVDNGLARRPMLASGMSIMLKGDSLAV
jgi:hypothetical protein